MSVAAACWALWYAIYRAYYAAGGTAFLTGTIGPDSVDEFMFINLVGAVVIGIAAVLPLAMLPLWERRWLRRAQLLVCWGIAVGCTMHAVVDIIQRVLSLAGAVTVDYPSMWQSIDRRATDLQVLFFNEPWFLIEGLLFGAIAWVVMGPGTPRRWWMASGLTALGALVLFGVLAMVGVIGRTVVF